jgi:hypothetical protein
VTLVVAISRADEYALMTCDSSSWSADSYGEEAFRVEDDGQITKLSELATEGTAWRSVSEVVEPDKVVQLTPYAMVATIGDHWIGWEFKNALLARVRESDGFDECSELARAVVEELERDDASLAGSIHDLAGRHWRRGSLHDEHAFSFLLTGFRSAGGTGMLYGAGATLTDVPEVDGSRSAISRPMGIDREDVALGAAEDHSLASAFGQAFELHNYLGSKYGEDRVTRDVNCTLLIHGDPPVPLSLTLDRTNVDAARAIYNTLRKRRYAHGIA